jgi:hypothetical protein
MPTTKLAMKNGIDGMITDPAQPSATLTRDEWEAVAILRTVGLLALQRGITALPDRVRQSIETANALLIRTGDTLS